MISGVLITLAELSVLIFIFALLNKLLDIGIKISLSRLFKNNPDKFSLLRQKIGLFILLICSLLCIFVIAGNGFLIYQGKDVINFQLDLIRNIPTKFWITLATALTKSISLLLLVKISLPLIYNGINFCSNYAQNYDRIKANDKSIENFFNTLKQIFTNCIWLWATIICLQFLQIAAVITKYLYSGLGIYLLISVGLLVTKVVPIVVDSLDELSLQFADSIADSDNPLRHYESFRHLIPLFKRCLEYILYTGIAALSLQYIDEYIINIVSWLVPLTQKIIGIISIFFISRVLIEIVNLVVSNFVEGNITLTNSQRQRRLTMAPLLKSFFKYLIYFCSVVVALKLINIDPAPILAGAGIVGIAVGLGAQNLINDIVCGFLILFENYYLVGDYIEAGKVEERPVEGIVEAIELRTTQIRHPDGQLQIVRNGEIGSVINYSKQYIYAKVDIPLPYNVNLEGAYNAIEVVGQELKAECPDVLESTQIEGIEALAQDYLLLRTLTKVNPGQHLYIQRLLRRKLKQAFDQENIVISDGV